MHDGSPKLKAQQMRSDLQLIPQRSPASLQQPLPPMSGGPLFSAPIAETFQSSSADCVGVSSQPLLSPPSLSQPLFNMGSQLPPVWALSQNQVRFAYPKLYALEISRKSDQEVSPMRKILDWQTSLQDLRTSVKQF